MKYYLLVLGILFSLGAQAKAKYMAINLDCGDRGMATVNAYFPVVYSGGETIWYNAYDEGKFIAYVYHHQVKDFQNASPETHFYCTRVE